MLCGAKFGFAFSLDRESTKSCFKCLEHIPYPSFRKRAHFKTLYIFQFYLYSKAISMPCVHCIASQQYPFIRTLNPCMRFESFA